MLDPCSTDIAPAQEPDLFYVIGCVTYRNTRPWLSSSCCCCGLLPPTRAASLLSGTCTVAAHRRRGVNDAAPQADDVLFVKELTRRCQAIPSCLCCFQAAPAALYVQSHAFTECCSRHVFGCSCSAVYCCFDN